jgi:putative flippase GtrA
MSKKALTIAALYTLSASLSTAINIGSQILSMAVYKGLYAIEISILFGTAAGLPLRYLLEKRHIFSFKANNVRHDGQLFVLYSFMGIFTTIIFWFVEYAFHLFFGEDFMRYVGGIIGLGIGFYVKYRLDKKYVFINRSNSKVML